MPSFPHSRGPVVGQHVGEYEIVSHLARGDMGELYQAHHPKSGRQVALKVLDAELCADPQLLGFYEHEVWTVNHLGHPAIMDVLDFGKLEGGRAYLVLKLLKGRNLEEHIAERGHFAPETTRELLRPVLEALVAIHGAGVTHKDIKPSNIFLMERPDGTLEPKLYDCGLAHLKPLAAVPGSAAQASAGLPVYNAPEQATGDLAAVGPWSDIYSVAAVIYHMLAGRPPFVGQTADEIVQQHLHAPPPDLAAVRGDAHPKLAAVLTQAMAKRPVERFESMQAFIKAFLSASALRAPTLLGPTGVPVDGTPAPGAIAAPPVGTPQAPRSMDNTPAPIGVSTVPLPQDRTPPPVGVPTAALPQGHTPPPTGLAGGPPRQDLTPPPTMRIEPGQFPLPTAAPAVSPAPVASAPAPAPAAAVPASGPTPVAAPAPAHAPAKVGPGKSRTGLWFLIAGLGVLLTGVVIVVVVFAIRSDDQQGPSEKKTKTAAAMAAMAAAPDAQVGVTSRPRVVVAPRPRVKHPPPRNVRRYRVDVKGRPWRGVEHARVTVALYCGFSSALCSDRRKTWQKLLDEFPKDMKLVWMDYPKTYLARSMPSSVAATEVFAQRGNAVFWKYANKLYDNPLSLSDANLARWAGALGASETKVREALQTKKHERAIKALASKAISLGVRTTPTLMINGILVKDTHDADDLEIEIRAEVDEANRVIAQQGVKLGDYYAHLMRKARTPLGNLGAQVLRPTRYYGPGTLYHVPVSAKRNPIRGPSDALVTVVMFGDFECIFTFRMACAVRAVMKKYPKDVRLVWMNRPLTYHSQALPAAEAAMAGFAQKGSKGFWAMADRIFPIHLCRADGGYRFGFFSHRKKLGAAHFLAAARKAGLKVSRYKKDLRLHTHQKQIKLEERLAKAFRSYGTPVLFVNGKKQSGYKRYKDLAKLVEAGRTEAKRLMRTKRVTRAKIYDTLIAKGIVARLSP